MRHLDKEKLSALTSFEDTMRERHGAPDSPERKAFEAKARAWYFAELLRDERKRQKRTQQSLAEETGMKRAYISALEQGQTDMQLSTFLQIAGALGMRFSLVVG